MHAYWLYTKYIIYVFYISFVDSCVNIYGSVRISWRGVVWTSTENIAVLWIDVLATRRSH